LAFVWPFCRVHHTKFRRPARHASYVDRGASNDDEAASNDDRPASGPSARGLDDFNVICGFAERSSERLFAHDALLRCLRRAAFARLLYPGPAAENEVNGAAAHALTV
jgi:hypothetical protein